MIKKIVAFSVVFFLIVSLALALGGVTRVEIGRPFLAFMSSINRDFAEFKLEIPDIPLIDKVPIESGWSDILNLLISFVNTMSRFINFLADIINIVLYILEFIVLLIKNIYAFIQGLIETSGAV